jgi:hypothetical protein
VTGSGKQGVGLRYSVWKKCPGSEDCDIVAVVVDVHTRIVQAEVR